jgi:hypothetical protein
VYFLNKWGPQIFEPSNRGPLKWKLRTISIGTWDRRRVLASLAPLSRASALLVLQRSALCNALCCKLCVVDLIDEHCQGFSVWMPWLSSDFLQCNFIFYFYFFSFLPIPEFRSKFFR